MSEAMQNDDVDKLHRTTFEYWMDGGAWFAREVSSSDDAVPGEGDNPREAVINYIPRLERSETE